MTVKKMHVWYNMKVRKKIMIEFSFLGELLIFLLKPSSHYMILSPICNR